MQQALWEQMVSETLEVTSQGSHSFEVYIKKDMETLDNLARNLYTGCIRGCGIDSE